MTADTHDRHGRAIVKLCYQTLDERCVMAWQRVQVSDEEAQRAVRLSRKKARFLVDENVTATVAYFLRSYGLDAKLAADASLQGHADEDVFAFAYRDNRVLLTHDFHFLDARRFPHHRNPGVVVLPGADGDTFALRRAMGWVLGAVADTREVWRGSRIQISRDLTVTANCWTPQQGRVEVFRWRFPNKDQMDEWIA